MWCLSMPLGSGGGDWNGDMLAVFVSREVVRLGCCCCRCCTGEENSTVLLVGARREIEACSCDVLILVSVLGLEALTVVSELIGRLCTRVSCGSGSLQIVRGVQSMKKKGRDRGQCDASSLRNSLYRYPSRRCSTFSPSLPLLLFVLLLCW